MTQALKIEATIWSKERKRYYKNTGLLYSFVFLEDIVVNGEEIKSLGKIKYGKVFHEGNFSKHDRISFVASSIDERGWIKNPRNFTKIDPLGEPPLSQNRLELAQQGRP